MAFLQIYYGYGAKYHVRSDYEVLVHHRLLQRCWCIAVLTTDHSMSSALSSVSLPLMLISNTGAKLSRMACHMTSACILMYAKHSFAQAYSVYKPQGAILVRFLANKGAAYTPENTVPCKVHPPSVEGSICQRQRAGYTDRRTSSCDFVTPSFTLASCKKRSSGNTVIPVRPPMMG